LRDAHRAVSLREDLDGREDALPDDEEAPAAVHGDRRTPRGLAGLRIVEVGAERRARRAVTLREAAVVGPTVGAVAIPRHDEETVVRVHRDRRGQSRRLAGVDAELGAGRRAAHAVTLAEDLGLRTLPYDDELSRGGLRDGRVSLVAGGRRVHAELR